MGAGFAVLGGLRGDLEVLGRVWGLKGILLKGSVLGREGDLGGIIKGLGL